MAIELPILAVCGWSGAGKTTLIEAVLPVLIARGLCVAVVKHDAHGLDIDRPGKDSDRFYRAGADVVLQGLGEQVCRQHAATPVPLDAVLDSLCHRHDLVLVEGHKATPLPKVWLAGPDESAVPDGVEGVLATLPRDADRPARLLALLNDWLPRCWRTTPVRAGILIGGRSSRMGRPKHLIEGNGQTWLARTADLLAPLVEQVVLFGGGEVPPSHQHLARLPDAPGVDGPMAGVLTAMRWAPRSSWLIVACDHPRLTGEAIDWLLSTRSPGVWAVLPCPAGQPEPLLAHYDFRSRSALEQLACQSIFSLRRLTGLPGVVTVPPPAALAPAWADVDCPDELDAPFVPPENLIR